MRVRVINQLRVSRAAESAAQVIAAAPNPDAALRQFETMFRSELIIAGASVERPGPARPPPLRRKPMA